jgi:hypothetical protein
LNNNTIINNITNIIMHPAPIILFII